MRFFTPDLLIRGNSSDDVVIDAADDEWERAVAGYQARLFKLRPRMPAAVRALADLNLHDGELLTWDAPAASGQSLVAVKLDDLVTSITYTLSGPIRVSPRRRVKPFTGRQYVDWLYEEVDVSPARPGAFVHRVLLSDGREVEVPFASVTVQRFPLTPPSSGRIVPAKSQVRQTA